MNMFILSKAGVNVAEGLQRFGSNQAMYEKYLKKFPDDTNYSALCKAVGEKDVKAAFSAAHTLKGVCGNLSFNKIYKDIYPFVEELRGGSMEHSEEYLEKISADYEEIILALEKD